MISAKLRWALWAAFAAAFIPFAWLSDDGYILMRTVDNFVHGRGLRWNLAERVQTFTCPLWTLLSAVPYALTHEPYYTELLLCVGVSLAAAWVIFRGAANAWVAIACGLVLVGSRAVLDYSTSGLENPLSHLLLVSFAYASLRPSNLPPWSRVFRLSLLGSLVVTTRMDLGLLVAPALAWELWRARSARALGWAVLGQLPFLAWELFATLYYGFPFPNTAYAKLHTGIARAELLQQGLWYLQHSARFDPITLTALAACLLALAVARVGAEAKALGVGVLAYLGYVLSVGGDFMSGRFFTAPLFLALAVVALRPPALDVRGRRVALAVLAVLALLRPVDALLEPLHPPFRLVKSLDDPHGIADERGFYAPGTGIAAAFDGKPMPSFGFRIEGDQDAARAHPGQVLIAQTIGMRGFYGGPTLHYLDRWALADPLLARMPQWRRRGWRIGHFERAIPDGYVETLQTGQNQLRDPGLARFYDRLSLLTRGELWSAERLRTLVAMNLGRYDALIDEDRYREPRGP